MSNPIFEFLHRNTPSPQPQIPEPLQNMQNFMQQFNQFRATVSGNPQQQVQQLLSSGQMTQEQFNQLSQMAHQLQKMMR